ncbi:hypothetical protein IKG20_01780 [Candidatus Saccharibacteria bacterium]|nr:hypothetical protein [Candidatus Saccharibacteria bacterium]
MRKDPYDEVRTRTNKHEPKPAEKKPAKRNSEKMNSIFSGNPPVRMEITYADGKKEIFNRDQIDADNPVIKALSHLNTARRFWRHIAAPKETRCYGTDEELIEEAARHSIPIENGTTAKMAEDAAKALNMVSVYFYTDETGEPIVGDDGNWLVAPNGKGNGYKPGTAVPAT